MTEEKLKFIIHRCKEKDPVYQKKLFMHMYNYGMNIASRYAINLHEAEEIANDGFFKMLDKIQLYKSEVPFKLWVRRIIINCGIDHYRKYKNKRTATHFDSDSKFDSNEGESKLDSDYLIQLIRKLSPQYKMVFILYIIEGYTHKEISERLNITIGTSKSNLSKARSKMKEMINIHNKEISNYGG